MTFQDNVLKAYLKNVYFITGTPCGGKTTISRELGKRHHLCVYDVDEQFEKHQKISYYFSIKQFNNPISPGNIGNDPRR